MLQREMLDVMVGVSFPKRKHRGKKTTRRRTFCLVAVRNIQLVIETKPHAGSRIMLEFVSEAPNPNVRRRKRAFDALPYLIYA